MKRALFILAVVLVGGFPILTVLGADIFVVPRVEERLEGAAEQPGAKAVDVEVSGFPVTARALILSEMAEVTFDWSEARLGPLRGNVRLALVGVAIGRGGLIAGDLRIEAVDSGRIQLTIPFTQIQRLLGREIEGRAGGDPMVALTPQESVPLRYSATPTSLLVAAGTFDPITVVLGGRPLPCAPEVDATADGLELSCSFRGLPALFRS